MKIFDYLMEIEVEYPENIYGFAFNENKVCVNPEKEYLWDDEKFKFQIRYACNENGKWAYGYDFEYKGVLCGCGGGMGPTSSQCATFDSKEHARLAAIKYAINYAKIKRNHNCPIEILDHRKIIA